MYPGCYDRRRDGINPCDFKFTLATPCWENQYHYDLFNYQLILIWPTRYWWRGEQV